MFFNRRHFLLGSLAAPLAAATKKQAQVERPNVLLLIAEDLGAYMLGCYGNGEVRTPNIDRIAQSGVRFGSSFSCAPIPEEKNAFAAAGYASSHAGSVAQAAELLNAQTPGKLFFLSVACGSPNHIDPPQATLDAYTKTSFEALGWAPAAPNATHKDMLRDVQANLRKYAAALSTLDDQIGSLVTRLHERGLWENTLVIFTSRNGYLLGRHGLWGDMTASDPPNMYEEAVRTPLIWMWPSRFPPQTVRNDVVSSYDLLPTLAELAGVQAPGGGQSYLTFVYGRRLGKKQTWLDVAFGRSGDTEMARDGRYKLVLRGQGKGPGELYDERADPREQVNQLDNPKYANTRERLNTLLAAWRSQRPAA